MKPVKSGRACVGGSPGSSRKEIPLAAVRVGRTFTTAHSSGQLRDVNRPLNMLVTIEIGPGSVVASPEVLKPVAYDSSFQEECHDPPPASSFAHVHFSWIPAASADSHRL